MPVGKWPAIVVVGKPVTEAQAREIIVRTSGLSFHSNNHEFTRRLHSHIYGIEVDNDRWFDHNRYIMAMNKYGIIRDLEYLTNHRIVSSYIGGPHGWCDWDGSIFCNTYNIGKYPSEKDVREEWARIATAFPYLDLKCQLWEKEVGEEGNKPEIQYNVKGGKVRVVKPGDLYVYPTGGDARLFLFVLQHGMPREDFERGCTIEEAIAAFDYVENRLKNKKGDD